MLRRIHFICFQGRYGAQTGSDEFGAHIMMSGAGKAKGAAQSIFEKFSNVEFYHVGSIVSSWAIPESFSYERSHEWLVCVRHIVRYWVVLIMAFGLDLNRHPRDPRSPPHIVPKMCPWAQILKTITFEEVVALACGYFPQYHPTLTQSQTVIFDTFYAYSNDKGAESEVMSDFPCSFKEFCRFLITQIRAHSAFYDRKYHL